MEIAVLSFAAWPFTQTKTKLFPQIHPTNGIQRGALIPKGKRKDHIDGHVGFNSYDSIIQQSNISFDKEKLLPGNFSNSWTLLLHHARNGDLPKATAIFDELMNSPSTPDAQLISQTILAFGDTHSFDTVSKILRQVELRHPNLLPKVCTSAIKAFGKRGQLEYMEKMVKEMVSMGFSIDSTVGNSYVIYYSKFASLSDAEVAYNRLKRSRILIEEEAIRALALAYIKENKFHALGRFVYDVGLGRKNVGNVLWNLLLLSYAARFKMKTLQREFLHMVEMGFRPDLNTFNIRSLAFSRMSLMWDLHLSLEHMRRERVAPDLVTYGCVVDAYVERKLGKNLGFALEMFDLNECVLVSTDSIVFEAMGKGEFHMSCEAAMEYAKERRGFTYGDLISRHLKKELRKNQIFWNR